MQVWGLVVADSQPCKLGRVEWSVEHAMLGSQNPEMMTMVDESHGLAWTDIYT